MKRSILLIILFCSPIGFLYSQRVLVDDCVLPKGDSKSDPDVVYWDCYDLHYYIQNSASTLSYSECQSAIQNAFNRWSKYSQFTFTQTTNLSEADITISWETGEHGDNKPFYPNSNDLAHATFGKLNQTPPCYIHFNDYIDFSSYNLYHIVLHEIGHILGLPDDNMHTTAVMFGSYGYFTNLTYYDVDALYNIYGYPFSINGSSYIEQYETYSINKIHPAYDVDWNLSDSYYNQNCLQEDNPSTNQCTITNSSGHDMFPGILTANIKHSGTTILSVTKNIYAFTGFKGTYISSMGSGQFTAPNPIYTGSNTSVHIFSPKLIGATVTYTGDATPSYWLQGYNTIDLKMPSSGSTIVVQVHCSTGDIYYIPIIRFHYLYQMSVSQNGESVTVTLDESVMDNQVWTLEVYNTITGKKMATQNIMGRSVTFNISDWKRDLYVVRAIVDKEVLTEKMQIR